MSVTENFSPLTTNLSLSLLSGFFLGNQNQPCGVEVIEPILENRKDRATTYGKIKEIENLTTDPPSRLEKINPLTSRHKIWH